MEESDKIIINVQNGDKHFSLDLGSNVDVDDVKEAIGLISRFILGYDPVKLEGIPSELQK